MIALNSEESVKQAYIEGFLTDAEFEHLIDAAVRGEQVLFFDGARKPDPVFGPDLITDPDLPED